MNSIERLKQRLAGKTAEEAVDILANTGALDHTLARRCIIVEEFELRYCNTSASARAVQEDIAEEFGTTRQTVRRYLGT